MIKKCPKCLTIWNRQHSEQVEGVYVTIKNPVICLFLYFTGVYFRGKLQHFGDVMSKIYTIVQSELEK